MAGDDDAVRRFDSPLERYVRELLRDADRAQRLRARARQELAVSPPNMGRSAGEPVAPLVQEPERLERSRPRASPDDPCARLRRAGG